MSMTAEELNELVKNKIFGKFGPEAIIENFIPYAFPTFEVPVSYIHQVLEFLKTDPELNFHFLTDLTGIQTPDEKKLGVIYHLHNMIKNYRIRLKTFVDIQKPEVPTATDLWEGANWMERETYDFFGVIFKGHPKLKRILNVDEMDIFPLRKEYPLEDQTRDDKDDRMFGR
ncbi:MAG: NADH-quinone oxidoreductase subunit C [Bacteroidia bacterium]|nr:NADH-quinone oxidoreductase subunit C [Bacteroidia bacterium]